MAPSRGTIGEKGTQGASAQIICDEMTGLEPPRSDKPRARPVTHAPSSRCAGRLNWMSAADGKTIELGLPTAPVPAPRSRMLVPVHERVPPPDEVIVPSGFTSIVKR